MRCSKQEILKKSIWVLSIVALILYPLRHVHQGVDLWDGGYNFANFKYMGTEYMDPMWLFATYLANAFGALLVRLPFGSTMVGLNFYTGLVVSAMAVSVYFFCVRKLKMPTWIAFVGEIMAVSLCWAPTAMLYTYLTYALFLWGTILLYCGITEEKDRYLVMAGVLLGLNVGVRFPNLVQAALIVVVWIYGFCCKKKLSRVLRETGLCMLGYVGALGLFLLFISVRYGFGEYVAGILRLFGMTEVATDYAAGSMLTGVVKGYLESSYWLKRLILLAVGGMAICLALPKKWIRVKQILTALLGLAVMYWLSQNGFYTKDYKAYPSIYYPCVIVLFMVLLVAALQLIMREVSRTEKLLAGLVVFTVLISPLGSNNAMYCNINNLFLVAPYFLWMLWKLCREKAHVCWFPLKCVLAVSAFFWLVQSAQFGVSYVYEEATGGRDFSGRAESVPVLQGVSTSASKAAQIEGLYAYIQEQDLGDRECILYGQIPGVSAYMELTPAINIWADLRSYGYGVMEADLKKVAGEIAAGGKAPVVILEAGHAAYKQGLAGSEVFLEKTAEQKMGLLIDFMDQQGYELTYENEKFALYQKFALY